MSFQFEPFKISRFFKENYKTVSGIQIKYFGYHIELLKCIKIYRNTDKAINYYLLSDISNTKYSIKQLYHFSAVLIINTLSPIKFVSLEI